MFLFLAVTPSEPAPVNAVVIAVLIAVVALFVIVVIVVIFLVYVMHHRRCSKSVSMSVSDKPCQSGTIVMLLQSQQSPIQTLVLRIRETVHSKRLNFQINVIPSW